MGWRLPGLVAVALSACATAPLQPGVAGTADGSIYLRNCGRLHVWTLGTTSAPVHQFISGLPAHFLLGDDSSAPTFLTVLEPLRFDAVTLFPAYYLERQIEQASPKVMLARGLGLHQVRREAAGNCSGFVGIGRSASEREGTRGSEVLGEYAPDLELGPFEVPCAALGGALDAGRAPILQTPWPARDWDRVLGQNPLMLTPFGDGEGDPHHYEETSFEIYARPGMSSGAGIGVRATATGARFLAAFSATLLETTPGWKKIRLVLGGYVLLIEGWVQEGLFQPADGSGSDLDGHGRLGGAHRSGPPPTYCVGRLAPGTPVFTSGGVAWATVSVPVEGVFEQKGDRHRLVNFFGKYYGAICQRPSLTDSQGIPHCIWNAEVRAADVTLRCPAGKPR